MTNPRRTTRSAAHRCPPRRAGATAVVGAFGASPLAVPRSCPAGVRLRRDATWTWADRTACRGPWGGACRERWRRALVPSLSATRTHTRRLDRDRPEHGGLLLSPADPVGTPAPGTRSEAEHDDGVLERGAAQDRCLPRRAGRHLSAELEPQHLPLRLRLSRGQGAPGSQGARLMGRDQGVLQQPHFALSTGRGRAQHGPAGCTGRRRHDVRTKGLFRPDRRHLRAAGPVRSSADVIGGHRLHVRRPDHGLLDRGVAPLRGGVNLRRWPACSAPS